jgi:hypothetical protein
MPVIYKAYWLLHTLAVVIAIGITGSYFVVDYNPGEDSKALPLFVTYSDLSLLLPSSIFYIQKWRRKAPKMLLTLAYCLHLLCC